MRTHEGESVLVLHNVSGTATTIPIPANLQDYEQVIFKNNNAKVGATTIDLPAFSTLLLKQ